MPERRKTEPETTIEISGPRVALRPLTDDDIATVEPWYGEAAAAVHGLPPEEAERAQRPRSVGRGPSLGPSAPLRAGRGRPPSTGLRAGPSTPLRTGFDRTQGRAGALPYGTDGFSIQDLHYQLEAARADPKTGLLVIARRDDPSILRLHSGQASLRAGLAPIGLLGYRADDPAPGWLSVGFIAVARPYRGLGYGSEAVRLLEGEASRRHRAIGFRAGVHVGNGLAFYFWLRLGYRPARPNERSWSSDAEGDIIWMIRRAENLEPRA